MTATGRQTAVTALPTHNEQRTHSNSSMSNSISSSSGSSVPCVPTHCLLNCISAYDTPASHCMSILLHACMHASLYCALPLLHDLKHISGKTRGCMHAHMHTGTHESITIRNNQRSTQGTHTQTHLKCAQHALHRFRCPSLSVAHLHVHATALSTFPNALNSLSLSLSLSLSRCLHLALPLLLSL